MGLLLCVLFFCEALYFQQEVVENTTEVRLQVVCVCENSSQILWPPSPVFGDHQANVQF